MNIRQPYIGRAIRELRADIGLSQDALAENAKVNIKTLISIEGGNPYQDRTLASISRALGKAPDDVRTLARKRLEEESERASGARQYSSRNTPIGLGDELAAIDAQVREEFGTLYNPGVDDEVDFSANRLFSSLSNIDIGPGIILVVIQRLPGLIRNALSAGGKFTTGTVRSAVARAIEGIDPAELLHGVDEIGFAEGSLSNAEKLNRLESRRREWLQRYCRKYGNPTQQTEVIELDGSKHKLTYEYLRSVLVPHALRHLLDITYEVKKSVLITKAAIGYMSESSLEEIRRLSLYSIRYRSALYLIEELALQPPHPWVVTKETQKSTLEYDLDRARAHRASFTDQPDMMPQERRHHALETFHHLCSAIMAVYGGFLGSHHTSPMSVLKNWMSIQHDNPALWDFCELRFLEADLRSVGSNETSFMGTLNALQRELDLKADSISEKALARFDEMIGFVAKLAVQREAMRDARIAYTSYKPVLSEHLDQLIVEFVRSQFLLGRSQKLALVEDRTSRSRIGLLFSADFHGTPLSSLSGRVLVVDGAIRNRQHSLSAVLGMTIDQFRAHHMVTTGFVLVDDDVSVAEFSSALEGVHGRAPQHIVFRLPFRRVLQQVAEGASFAEIIDFVVDQQSESVLVDI